MATIVLGDTRLKVADGLSKADHDEIVDDYVSRRMQEAGVMSPEQLQQTNMQERQVREAADAEAAGPMAAYQQGAANLGKNLLQMALPKSLEEKFTRAAKAIPDFQLLPDYSERGQEEFERKSSAMREAHPKSMLAGEIIPSLAVPAGGTLPRAVAGGAGIGAALGGPENRAGGAALGAVGGGLGHGAARALGRTLGRGTVKQTPEAARLHRAGVDAPLAQAADSTAGGATSTIRAGYEHLVPFFPTARAALDRQGKEFARAGAKAVEGADIMKGGLTIADDLKSVMSEGVSQKSNIMFRNIFYKIGNFLGPILGFGTLGAFRGMATKGFQKFLMGSTKWQETINRALKTGDAHQIQQALGQAARAYGIAEASN